MNRRALYCKHLGGLLQIIGRFVFLQDGTVLTAQEGKIFPPAGEAAGSFPFELIAGIHQFFKRPLAGV